MNIRIFYILLISLLLVSNVSFSQKTKKIKLLHADRLKGGGVLGTDVKRLIGNVSLKHGEAIMHCDSAYFNSTKNMLDAFSNVHIIQGDSLNLYGDYLKYNGNTKISEVRNNVRLIHGDATLTTDSLDFDRKINQAHYFDHGRIIDSKNDLTSINGFYYSNTKDYFAIDSVLLVNKQYIMTGDTLKYNTETDISYFFGPTTIVSDSNYIYCENGWYDTKNNVSQFNKNAYLLKGSQKLSGDSLFYDRNIGLGKAFINVTIVDTMQKVTIKGEKGLFFENPEVATVTDSAVLIQISENDTLFLHADTLKMVSFTDTIYFSVTDTFELSFLDSIYSFIKLDSINEFTLDTVSFAKDSTDTLLSVQKLVFVYENDSLFKHKKAYAYNKARLYKSDLQAKTDSLMYVFKDSVIQFYGTPVLWSDENQINGEVIEMFMRNNEAHHFHIQANAMIVSEDDSIRFNQISGKEIYGYFKKNEIHLLKVLGNAESVYYAREEAKDTTQIEKGELIGPNVAKGSNMNIYLKNRKPAKIVYLKSPDGTLSPVNYKTQEELRLKNFTWQIDKRPTDRYDIFNWR